MKSVLLGGMVIASLLLCGCDLVDPARPTQVKDAELFGNLLEAARSEEDAMRWVVKIQGGAPRALRSAEESQGKPTPSVEKGLIATVTVTSDTVVIANDAPAVLGDIDPGTEVVVLPVSGSTRMVGSDDIRVEAQMLMDFSTYQRWRLPRLVTDADVVADDPGRINSSGSETAPVPVADGSVLYFSAHLRPPAADGESWHGAIRDGLVIPDETQPPVERSYRTERTEEGWTAPELVVFPDLETAGVIRVTWVNDDETRCLLTVIDGEKEPRIASAVRSGAQSAWGSPQFPETLGADASGGVFLTGSETKMVFVSGRDGRDRSDLFLHDPDNEAGAMPLEPQINTFGAEWCPRTGPNGELFFCREDRQLVFTGGRVTPLRLPGPHRILFTQAAPTSNGKWVFFCLPRYRPHEFDDDIYVAPLNDNHRIGKAVPVDDWRP
jgi:hypothetical protein